jgi:hypothetical protein
MCLVLLNKFDDVWVMTLLEDPSFSLEHISFGLCETMRIDDFESGKLSFGFRFALVHS